MGLDVHLQENLELVVFAYKNMTLTPRVQALFICQNKSFHIFLHIDFSSHFPILWKYFGNLTKHLP